MPAMVYLEYTDDGCSRYRCSSCDEVIESRSNARYFFHCPYCGVPLLHNEEAHTQEAREKREEREEYRFFIENCLPAGSIHYRYWFRAIIPATTENWRAFFDEETIEYGMDSIKKLGSGWGAELPSPFRWVRWPQDWGTTGWLSRKNLVNAIRKWHGYPMWFGIVKEDD